MSADHHLFHPLQALPQLQVCRHHWLKARLPLQAHPQAQACRCPQLRARPPLQACPRLRACRYHRLKAPPLLQARPQPQACRLPRLRAHQYHPLHLLRHPSLLTLMSQQMFQPPSRPCVPHGRSHPTRPQLSLPETQLYRLRQTPPLPRLSFILIPCHQHQAPPLLSQLPLR